LVVAVWRGPALARIRERPPVGADFVAKVLLHSSSKFILVVQAIFV
jgi:hypothetical protein